MPGGKQLGCCCLGSAEGTGAALLGSGVRGPRTCGPSPVAAVMHQLRRDAAAPEGQGPGGPRAGAEASEPSRGSPAPRPWGRGCPSLALTVLPKVQEHLATMG